MRTTPWVARLIFANVAVFILGFFFGAQMWRFMLVPLLVPQMPWTPFTYMFLHAGLTHLLFNMIALFFFGPRVEERLGGRRFLGLYLVAGLGGAALSFLTPEARIVGASGAVFGVMLAFAHFWPREQIWIWGVFPVEARVLVIVSTAIAVFSGFFGTRDGIAHFAHLGGYVGAWIYLHALAAFSPATQFRRRVETATYGRSGGVTADDVPRWESIRREGMHPLNIEELDRVLAKIREHGPGSLTPDERAFLHRMSAR